MMSKRRPISLEVKLRDVKRCLQNETNPSYEAKQLEIDKNTVTDWIRKYSPDGHEGLKESRGCKTTFEERIEIAQYQKSKKKYDVSYQQVYTWVRKYKFVGEEALRENRGRNKPAKELDDHERFKLRIKELEARNDLEMENAFAKKLAEIRRRNTH